MRTAVEKAASRAMSGMVELPARCGVGTDEDSNQAVQRDVFAAAVSELTG